MACKSRLKHVGQFQDSDELSNLGSECFGYLERFLHNVLASSVAEDTFAQLIDGIPTRSSFERCAGSRPWTAEVLERHTPSEAAIDTFRTFRAQLQLTQLHIDLKAVQALQDAPLPSRDFYLRVLHVAALVIHSLGGSTFMSSHPEININPEDGVWDNWPHFVVDFYHGEYLQYSSFPYGILDTIGYWAETQIFGGVVLFDQATVRLEDPHAYIHSPDSTAFQISVAQLENLVRPQGVLPAGGRRIVGGFRPFRAEAGAYQYQLQELYGKSIWRDEFSKTFPSNGTAGGCVRLATEKDYRMIAMANAMLTAKRGKGTGSGPSDPRPLSK